MKTVHNLGRPNPTGLNYHELCALDELLEIAETSLLVGSDLPVEALRAARRKLHMGAFFVADPDSFDRWRIRMGSASESA